MIYSFYFIKINQTILSDNKVQSPVVLFLFLIIYPSLLWREAGLPAERIIRKLFFFILFCILQAGGEVFSQQQFHPLNRENNLWLERHLNKKDNFSHTDFKPYLEPQIDIDSLTEEEYNRIHNGARTKERNKWLYRKLKKESLVIIDSGDFHFTIDPLFNFQYGFDFADTSLRADTTRFFTNSRGILVHADFGKKVSVSSSFMENQSYFPKYIDDFVKTYQVVPGNGRVKPFKITGYDYAMASGYISFSPYKNLNFQIGHDKNFIGDGYRSLLLSDNAFNYPFLKITSSFWNNRIQYTNLYSELSSLQRIPVSTTPEALFKPKAGTFHYLSFIPWKHLHMGFFEGIIWQRWDSAGTKPFDWNFVNPVIFSNTAVYGLNGKNNSIVGANLKLKILKGIMVYSQLILDDGINKEGYQFGLKGFDLFTLKNLNFQIEYNKVQSYTYTYEIPLQSFYHYNQPLAHPLGNGFEEFVGFFDYKWKDFFVQLKFNVSELSNKEIFIQNYKVGYLINHRTNMNIFAGFFERIEKYGSPGFPIPGGTTQLLYLGIHTSLSNQYFDF